MATRKPTTDMSPAEYREVLAKLGFDDPGEERRAVPQDEGLSEAARFFGAAPRTGRLWAANGPPAAVALCLRLMLALKIDLTTARAALGRLARKR